jgi:hypothetical protein
MSVNSTTTICSYHLAGSNAMNSATSSSVQMPAIPAKVAARKSSQLLAQELVKPRESFRMVVSEDMVVDSFMQPWLHCTGM